MELKEAEKLISSSLMRLRMRSPFFATLALFARFHPFDLGPTAFTDGRDIYYNPSLLASLPLCQRDAVLLHMVLHAAFLHIERRGNRDPDRWNLAADIVVNGILARESYLEMPPGSLRDEELEDKPIEEIYELLPRQKDFKVERCMFLGEGEDLRPRDKDKAHWRFAHLKASLDQQFHWPVQSVRYACQPLEAYWRQALRQAEIMQRSVGRSRLPLGLERMLAYLSAPQIDWRSYLWRFLVKTPTDFAGFDRRFLGRGLYLDAIEGEGVKVYVSVDTSGSISDAQLDTFLAELLGILGSYPHLEAQFFYADAALYGPYSLKAGDIVAMPQGRGGTSFVPFFERIEAESANDFNVVCIYLTDGFGEFPKKASRWPTLWVVTPGGRREEEFPFGEVVRLLRDG